MNVRPARPVLLYDADCRFCRWSARLVAACDRGRRLGFLPLQDPDAAPLLASLRPEERLASWRLVEPDGTMHSRGAGAIAVLESLPRARPAARLLRVLHAGRALDAGYGLVARNRSRLGRLVPDRPGPVRRP